jgi:2-polyprenyl-6-methoxyphenol hydroxylase-like FAD-dependent oxidoreductase
VIDVLVVGAGAVGLYAAAAFATAGLDVEVWEKRGGADDDADPESRPRLSRAIGIHPPALHALDIVGLGTGLGVGAAVASEAVQVRRAHARVTTAVGAGARPVRIGGVSFADVSRRFPFVATLPQHRTEALLDEAIAGLATASGHGTVAITRGIEVVGIAPDARGVTVRGVSASTARASRGARTTAPGATAPDAAALDASARAGRQTTARFVVIAEGSGGLSSRRLGVHSRERTYPDTYLMGDATDATGDGEDAVVTLSPDGVVESFPLPGGVRRFVAHTPTLLDGAGPETLARLVATRTGHRFDAASVTMLSTFGVRRRIADRFTVGSRIAIVGDAAHEISPIGGQGMNLGWLDVAELVPVVVALLRAPVPGAAVVAATESLDAWSARRRRVAVMAARQAELNMRVSAPGSSAALRVRSVALGAALRGRSGATLARVYAMGGDPAGAR